MTRFADRCRRMVSKALNAISGAMITLLAMALLGCQSAALKYAQPEVGLPDRYLGAKATARLSDQTGQLAAKWWLRMGSEELNALVMRGLSNNPDLKISNLQVEQAKIKADQVRSGNLPYIVAPIKMVGQSSNGGGDAQQNSEVSLSATYRIDLWGEQKSAVEASDLMVMRAIYERDSVERNVVTAIVNTYISYAAIGDSISLARANEVLTSDTIATVEQRYRLEDATINELESQRAMAYSQQMIVPALESQRSDISNTIARLVGVAANIGLQERSLDELQVPNFSIGLPSRLLLQRPDIRAVESRMRSANASIEIARAKLFPTVELSGQVGFSGMNVSSLFSPQSMLINSVASIATVIFDGGRREKEQAYAVAYHEEMVETYRKVVLQAFYEVESAISTLRSAQIRLEAQRSATRAALRGFQATSSAYAVEAVDTATLLDARKNYQRSSDDLIKAKADLLRAHVSLVQAIGGDISFDGKGVRALGTDSVQN